ncbi:hypothetical protein RRG08_010148, partial [Elysia crispata]
VAGDTTPGLSPADESVDGCLDCTQPASRLQQEASWLKRLSPWNFWRCSVAEEDTAGIKKT